MLSNFLIGLAAGSFMWLLLELREHFRKPVVVPAPWMQVELLDRARTHIQMDLPDREAVKQALNVLDQARATLKEHLDA